MTAMKKNITFGMIGALALVSLASCNQKLLDIPQKGVVAYEDFYHTDADAQSALTAVYHEFINLVNDQGSNNPAWNVVTNATGDELYWGGGKKNGSSSGAQDMNEFRNTYDSTIPHIRVVYKDLYALIYKCNLVLDNFYGEEGELCDSPVKKRCVAEARVVRAWAHFTLACYWGTPPLVEHVLAGDARPTNCDHQVLMDWVIAQYKMALPDLEPRKGKTDKPGAWKITTGNCLAFLGKAQVFNKDWAGAKASLKQVIESGNYALSPTADLWNMFHKVGDGNEEKVLEMNYVYADGLGPWKYHFQRNQALFLRNIKKYPNVVIVRTMSKSRALAGLRVGYAFGSKELIKALHDVKFSVNSYTLNMPALAAGVAAASDREYFEETVDRVLVTREKTKEALRSCGFTVPESRTNFLFAKPPEGISAESLFEKLKEKDIYVRFFKKPRLSDYLRITIGTDAEMEQFIKVLQDIL